MSCVIQCDACSARYSLSTKLFEQRFAGKRISMKCRKCGQQFTVDSAPPKSSTGGKDSVPKSPAVATKEGGPDRTPAVRAGARARGAVAPKPAIPALSDKATRGVVVSQHSKGAVGTALPRSPIVSGKRTLAGVPFPATLGEIKVPRPSTNKTAADPRMRATAQVAIAAAPPRTTPALRPPPAAESGTMVRHPVVATDPASDSLEELAAVEALPTIQPEPLDSEQDLAEGAKRDSSAALTVPCDARTSEPEPTMALELQSQGSTPGAELGPAGPEPGEPITATSAAEEIPAEAVMPDAGGSVGAVDPDPAASQGGPPRLPAVASAQETLPASAAFAKTELALQAPASLGDVKPGTPGSQATKPTDEPIDIPGLAKRPARLHVVLPVLLAVSAICAGVLFLTMGGRDSPKASVNPHGAKKAAAKSAPKPAAPPKTKVDKAQAAPQTRDEPPKVTAQEPGIESQPESKPKTQPAEQSEPAENQQAGSQDIPASLHAPLVLHRVHMALHQARKCNPGGHAVGTSDVFVTFGPDGRVSDAQVVGGDLMGTPVSKCIVLYARSVTIPAFDGEPFTVKESVTLH